MTEVRPGSTAAMAGIKPGTVILQANRKRIKDATDFKKIIKDSKTTKSVVLLILSDDYQRYVVLNWK